MQIELANNSEQDQRLKGSPCVLVVDDEELMREITKLIVEENGGSVLLASDGDEGVEIFKKNAGKIDYIFIDFSMPKLNGYEAILKMRSIKPDCKILMASGLKPIPEIIELVKNNQLVFLSKPFHEAELVTKLNALHSA